MKLIRNTLLDGRGGSVKAEYNAWLKGLHGNSLIQMDLQQLAIENIKFEHMFTLRQPPEKQ